MAASAFDDRLFDLRLERSREDLFGMLERLYGAHPDYAAFVEALERDACGRPGRSGRRTSSGRT